MFLVPEVTDGFYSTNYKTGEEDQPKCATKVQ